MRSFEIVAGTYEEYLLGYAFNLHEPKLVQSFASHDHSSSIRAVATCGKYLASGSADDRIIIYDLKRRKEHCVLTHHDSTINCLQFTHNHSHLISGSSDGVLAIVRVGNWQVEKIWNKAHNGMAILDIAVHSSGKLALTLGADFTLRTWNLVKGRQAFIVNLNSKSNAAKSLEKIVWAEDAARFILYGGRCTEIWSIVTGGILKSIEHNRKISCCIWLSPDTILVGHEDGQLASVNINNLKRIDYDAHSGRIKAIVKYNNYIVTASSDGRIKVWSENLKELAVSTTGCRITCLNIVPMVELKKEEEENVHVEERKNKSLVRVAEKRSVVIELEDNEYDSHMLYKNKTNNRVIIEESKLKKKRKLQEKSQNEVAEHSMKTCIQKMNKKSRKIAASKINYPKKTLNN